MMSPQTLASPFDPRMLGRRFAAHISMYTAARLLELGMADMDKFAGARWVDACVSC
jgi:hypothetical protein